jgi:hypothetical protein
MTQFFSFILGLSLVYTTNAIISVPVEAVSLKPEKQYISFVEEGVESQLYYFQFSQKENQKYQEIKAERARIAEEARLAEIARQEELQRIAQAEAAAQERKKALAVKKQRSQSTARAPVAPVSSSGGSVESLIRYWTSVYGGNPDYHISIARCESGLNPDSRGSGGLYAGVFQQNVNYWPQRAGRYGFGGSSPYDANANIAVSIAMMIREGYGHWTCA